MSDLDRVSETGVAAGPEALPLRAVLVDDQASIRRAHAMLLKRLGFQVEPVDTPAKALDLVRTKSRPVTLLVTDCHLAGACGLELAAEIQHEHPQVVVVVTSGDPFCVEAARSSGIAALQKPFSGTQLRDRLSSLGCVRAAPPPSPARSRCGPSARPPG